jgi:hypothetical protein
MEPPYSMIDELAERPSVTEANKLLCEGWVLIKSAELLGVDQQGCQIATIMYILGHVKDKKRSLPVKPRDLAVSGSTTPPVAEGNDHPTPRRQAVAQAAAPSPPNILSLPIVDSHNSCHKNANLTCSNSQITWHKNWWAALVLSHNCCHWITIAFSRLLALGSSGPHNLGSLNSIAHILNVSAMLKAP